MLRDTGSDAAQEASHSRGVVWQLKTRLDESCQEHLLCAGTENTQTLACIAIIAFQSDSCWSSTIGPYDARQLDHRTNRSTPVNDEQHGCSKGTCSE